MKTLTQINLELIEETKHKFFEVHGKNCENEKRLFINWYVENHKAPLSVLVYDLSNYYLHISENRILRLLK